MEDQGDLPQQMPRREFLRKSVTLVSAAALIDPLTIAVGEYDLSKYPTPSVHAPDASVSKENLNSLPTEFGFNTHLHLSPADGDNMNIDFFIQNVDRLVENGQSQIRLNLLNSDVVSRADASGVEFNKRIDEFASALEYAKLKGLRVNLATSTPESAANLSKSDYISMTRHFYTELASRLAGKVDVWQVFNEADIHNFRDYKFNRDQILVPGYMNELFEVVGEAVRSIKSVDPKAKTTMNVSRWVGDNTDLIKKGSVFFDKLGRFIDIISLDLYPDTDTTEIKRLPKYIEYFQKRYNKPVVVAELGMPTNRFTQKEQKTIIGSALNALRGGRIRPQAVLLYELTDETATGDPGENSFGFLDFDAKPKYAFNYVVESMQKPKPQK